MDYNFFMVELRLVRRRGVFVAISVSIQHVRSEIRVAWGLLSRLNLWHFQVDRSKVW